MKALQFKQLLADFSDDSDISIALTPEFVASVLDASQKNPDSVLKYEFNLRLRGTIVAGELVASIQFVPTYLEAIGTGELLGAKGHSA